MSGTELDGTYWRAFVDASPDIVLVIDREGTILFVNRVVRVFAERGVIGRKMWEFAVGDAQTRLTEKLRQVVESKKALVYENPGLRQDGSPGWYEVRAIPVVVDGAVERVLWMSTDITNRRELEAQMRQAQKMEALGQLAGGVAHDFNNLLAVIMGYGDLAARGIPPGHPVKEQLDEVLDAARRGGELTRKLLALSRKQILQPRAIDAHATVKDLARVMQRILGEDIDVVVEEAPLAVPIHADPLQLEQVLMNLWTNARHAMPNGGTLRLATRTVDFDAAFVAQHPWAKVGSFGEITVSDTGSGMDEATLGRIFEPFFTTKPEGTGLGLSTVDGIVHQHEGFLHVESTRGAGTTMHVYLPTAGDAVTLPGPHQPSFVPDILRGSELVLIAEDEPSLRALVTTTLAELGYRVIATRDGEEALRELERHKGDIALAVLDVVMPRLNARQVYERMRAIYPGTRVLFTTGYAPSSARMGELAGTLAPILEKPFTALALAAHVRRAIDAPAPQP